MGYPRQALASLNLTTTPSSIDCAPPQMASHNSKQYKNIKQESYNTTPVNQNAEAASQALNTPPPPPKAGPKLYGPAWLDS